MYLPSTYGVPSTNLDSRGKAGNKNQSLFSSNLYFDMVENKNKYLRYSKCYNEK
jgi:hypothetical protein